MGRRNDGCQHGGRSLVSERLAGPGIEPSRHGVEIGLAVDRQVGPLGEILAQQAVGVLVGAPLPGAVWVAEVHREVGLDREAAGAGTAAAGAAGAAAGVRAPAAPAFGSSGGAACLIWTFSVNSFTRRSFVTGEGTDLISTSSGCCSQGDDSMLRINVETRALDCA